MEGSCRVSVTSMASKPQYSLASSSRGTSACSKRVVPHVFKMKRLLETNMLLSLRREREKEKTQEQIRGAQWWNRGTASNVNMRETPWGGQAGTRSRTLRFCQVLSGVMRDTVRYSARYSVSSTLSYCGGILRYAEVLPGAAHSSRRSGF